MNKISSKLMDLKCQQPLHNLIIVLNEMKQDFSMINRVQNQNLKVETDVDKIIETT